MSDLMVVLVVILILVILWRGPKTLPKLGAALGRGVREARTEASKSQAELSAEAEAHAGDRHDAPDEQRPA
jgi:Sec-independent protein translocase protein TatA